MPSRANPGYSANSSALPTLAVDSAAYKGGTPEVSPRLPNGKVAGTDNPNAPYALSRFFKANRRTSLVKAGGP
jgi:hypothetical protein